MGIYDRMMWYPKEMQNTEEMGALGYKKYWYTGL